MAAKYSFNTQLIIGFGNERFIQVLIAAVQVGNTDVDVILIAALKTHANVNAAGKQVFIVNRCIILLSAESQPGADDFTELLVYSDSQIPPCEDYLYCDPDL